MSRNEWEQGTVKLPSAEFTRLRKALEVADTKHKTELFEHSQKFWQGLTAKQKSDTAAYREALYAYDLKHDRTVGNWRSSRVENTLPEGFCDMMERFAGFRGNKPRRMLKTDVSFPSNRTVDWDNIHFEKENSTVSWTVEDNNHAVEWARAKPLAVAFFAELHKVKWTKGTGGYFTGNNEYNDEGKNEGGGANYITSGYGPIGAIRAPQHTYEFTMSDGKRIRLADFEQLAKDAAAAERREENKRRKANGLAPLARVSKGQSAGGQWTARGFSGAEVYLHF